MSKSKLECKGLELFNDISYKSEYEQNEKDISHYILLYNNMRKKCIKKYDKMMIKLKALPEYIDFMDYKEKALLHKYTLEKLFRKRKKLKKKIK